MKSLPVEFDRATAEAIRELADFPTALRVEDDGLYVAEEFKDRSIGTESTPSRIAGVVIFDSTPAEDMDWPGAPNPATAPALPIPFTSAQLAAFLLDGAGRSIQDQFGRLGDPLNAQALARFNPQQRWPRQALEEAYRLAEVARANVGAFEFDKQREAYALLDESAEAATAANEREGVFEAGITTDEANARRERAKASVAAQADRAEAAVREVLLKWVVWRRAMVRELLDPSLAWRRLKQQSEHRRSSNPELYAKFARADALFEKLCEIKREDLDYEARQRLAEPYWREMVDLECGLADMLGNGESQRDTITQKLRDRLDRWFPGRSLGTFEVELRSPIDAQLGAQAMPVEPAGAAEPQAAISPKKRGGRGNKALTPEQIEEAKTRRQKGELRKCVAADLGVREEVISRIAPVKRKKPASFFPNAGTRIHKT